MGKFDDAIGELPLKVDKMNGEQVELTLRPDMTDLKKFKRIMYDQKTMNDMSARMEKFKEYATELIMKNYPEEEKESVQALVELNDLKLNEELMIGFRMTTRDELEKNKLGEGEKLKKKLTDGN